MKNKKYFFGWQNIRWAIKELIAMYSNKDSYFSKKRLESSLAFIGGYLVVIHHAWSCRATITNSEIIADATLLFVIAGYTVRQIQSEKKGGTGVIATKSPVETKAPEEDIQEGI